ncbi:MAG TPA: hypothetical protein VFE03_01030, partial [Caulobacteraceae bacterium]|nr:hypothetical protein [Caulobacteraceae bacterium]
AALTDLAEFLPTAHLEGGPAPQALAPDAADWAAALSGGYASRAIAEEAAPAWLRRVFLRLTAIGLDWAAASLGLPERDGRDWRLI